MGKPQAVVAKVNTNPSQSSFSAKKTILCASPKPARPGPISRVSKLAPQQAQKPAPLDTNITKKVQEPPQAQKQPAAKPAKKKKAELKPTQQVMPTRHSVRLAIKQTASSAAKQAAPDKDPPARSTKTSATRKGVGSTNKATVKKNSRACSEHKSAKGVRTSNRKKARPSPEKDNDSQNSTKSTEKGPIEDPMIEVPIPTTPKKSYQPVHPSPLLHCRSASKLRREAIYVPESMSVNDPAWIPGASAPEVEDKLGFEDAFGATFSPFRFTAGSESNEGSSFQFTFRMEANTGPNSTQSPEAGDKPARSSIVSESSMNISHVNENVSASLLEDLITFSDSSNCCTPPQEPTQKSIRITRSASKRRNSGADAENDIMGPAATKSPKTGSVRKSARKGRSSSKGYKPSQSVENEGADMDLSKPCKNSSPLSEIIVNSPGSTPTKAEPLHKSTKKNPSSSKQHKSSGVGMHRMGGEVVRNLELDYDKENVPHVEGMHIMYMCVQ